MKKLVLLSLFTISSFYSSAFHCSLGNKTPNEMADRLWSMTHAAQVDYMDSETIQVMITDYYGDSGDTKITARLNNDEGISVNNITFGTYLSEDAKKFIKLEILENEKIRLTIDHLKFTCE